MLQLFLFEGPANLLEEQDNIHPSWGWTDVFSAFLFRLVSRPHARHRPSGHAAGRGQIYLLVAFC